MVQNKWKIRLQLTKPVTWPPLVWGVVCGAAASGNFHWNFEDVAKSIVCMMMSGPFLTGYTQTLNDWYDREIDAINEPYRSIPSGAISENEVITQIWVLLLGGLSLAGILDIWAGHDFPIVFYLAVGGAILSYIYSAPPLKLDDRSEKHVFIGYDASSKGYKLYNPNNGKTIVSRDVEFYEEGTWNWEEKEDTYDFFPYFEEIDEEALTPNDSTPALLPTPSTNEASSSSKGSSSERPIRMRNIQELYDETEVINDLFYLFVDSEPLNFDEAMKDKRWRQAMEEEIKAIEKNNT
ncbi:Chlorophyll synthase, chloroplastic [Glycine soja]|uniref:Chlorophyll synthase, chloroplastic n=1 Tax=Glycine soja TaxID=3848 RepID=A0A445GGR0_GLYSO|nr:Chlorophyll synthase, chloroplastic [Glycine soja]